VFDGEQVLLDLRLSATLRFDPNRVAKPSGKMTSTMNDVTDMLTRWNRGDREALSELMPLVYGELHRLAERCMAREDPNHTLQPTALVHEAYLRLTNSRSGRFNNRIHFYGAAAQAMRRIPVDHAPQRGARKRGADPIMLNLDDVDVRVDLHQDLIALDDALTRLSETAPRPAQVVELRYFGECRSTRSPNYSISHR
jgi:RNA polymerase sigma-70 factor, ECF subfamily